MFLFNKSTVLPYSIKNNIRTKYDIALDTAVQI